MNTFNVSSLLFNVICNLIASFVFIFALLYFLKPKFEIVPFIAKNNSPFDDVEDICYSFKIINKSLFGAYDIQAKANYYTISQGENGIVNKIFSKINLKTDKINFVPCFKSKIFSKNYGENCIQFFTYDDLSSKLDTNCTYIQFQVTAKHSLTGLNNIFTYEFVNKGMIIEGRFKEGNYKEVIKC